MFLAFTVEIFGDLNRDLKCALNAFKFVYFISRVPVLQKLWNFCGKLVLAYMSSGKNLKMSACVDL